MDLEEATCYVVLLCNCRAVGLVESSWAFEATKPSFASRLSLFLCDLATLTSYGDHDGAVK